ncbi:MAG: hypothetical protein WCK42_10310, partial [Myxococcaceae bacterium]
MVVKVLVAISVGFAVSIPLTKWLLKKVRIKSKVWHFQVLSVIGLPILLFVFLLQTSFAVSVIVITFTALLFVVVLELTLRRLVSKSQVQKIIKNGPNGAQAPFEQARCDSGKYPYDYMTEDAWHEMRNLFKEMVLQSEKALQKHGENEEIIWSYQKNKYVCVSGEYYSIFNGIRGTSDFKHLVKSKRVLIFGGSTVFCEETPDRLTIASFLQRVLNMDSSSVEVVNCGWSGASVIERSKMLTSSVTLSSGDSVVFLFGDNDSGWHVIKSDGRRIMSNNLLPVGVRVMRTLGYNFGFELAKWMYGEVAPHSFRKFSSAAVADTINSLSAAREYCQSKGAHMVAILQPNLYTLRTKSQYERQLEKRFSINMRSLVLDAYRRYEGWVKETPYAVSATHIFDNAPASVFLDWAHVNARGNEFIAKFIFEELKKRNLI